MLKAIFTSHNRTVYAQTFGLNIPTAHYTHSLSALEMLHISRADKPPSNRRFATAGTLCDIQF
jgi:hypothetical protein